VLPVTSHERSLQRSVRIKTRSCSDRHMCQASQVGIAVTVFQAKDGVLITTQKNTLHGKPYSSNRKDNLWADGVVFSTKELGMQKAVDQVWEKNH
jgi:hypothetical protein